MEWAHLLSIEMLMVLLIDIALSVDNAAVNASIAMMFPKHMRGKILLIGVIGAVVMRIILAFCVGWLYDLPGLKFLGGLWVVLMGIKMLTSSDEDEGHTVNSSKGYLVAGLMLAWTDLSMSFDNVIALVAAANGSMTLVIVGVAITIPLLFWGTKIVIAIMEKFPIANYFFAGLLGFIGVKMIVEDTPSLERFFHWLHTFPEYAIGLGGFILVVAIGILANMRGAKKKSVDATVNVPEQANAEAQ